MSLVHWTVSVAVLSLASPLLAQLPGPAPIPVPVRVGEPSPSRGPNTRTIPVGTATLSGVAVAADSGRPIRGARVMLNGSTVDTPSTPITVIGTVIGRVGGPGQISPPASLGSATSVARSVLTDDQGRFTFPKLPAGLFSLNVSKNQFLNTNYGQKRVGGMGTRIRVTDGQQMSVTISMQRGAVVTGMVFGEDGEPQANARVSVWRFSFVNGVRRLQQNNGGSSDDRGVFRLFNLQPGDYTVGAWPSNDNVTNDRAMADMQAVEQAIVSSTPRPTAPGQPPVISVTLSSPPPPGVSEGPPAGFLPTYLGNSLERANASVVRLEAGEERAGLDIRVQPRRSTVIQGQVAAPISPEIAVQLSLISADPLNAGTTSGTRAQSGGRFALRDVAPGTYTLFAQTVQVFRPTPNVDGVMLPPAAPPRLDDSLKLWGAVPVTVNGEPMIEVNLALQPGRTISGTVVSELTRPRDPRATLTVVLTPAPTSDTPYVMSPQATVGEDGRFVISGVTPGRYQLRASALNKSAIVDGVDTLDFPLEVTGDRDISGAVLTISDKFTELSGVLTDATGKPGFDYTIVAIPTDPRYWTPGSRRILMTRPSTDGRYVFGNLPPGSYGVAAVTDIEAGGQFDPEFLKTVLPSTIRVNLTEAAKIIQNIRVAR